MANLAGPPDAMYSRSPVVVITPGEAKRLAAVRTQDTWLPSLWAAAVVLSAPLVVAVSVVPDTEPMIISVPMINLDCPEGAPVPLARIMEVAPDEMLPPFPDSVVTKLLA